MCGGGGDTQIKFLRHEEEKESGGDPREKLSKNSKKEPLGPRGRSGYIKSPLFCFPSNKHGVGSEGAEVR